MKDNLKRYLVTCDIKEEELYSILHSKSLVCMRHTLRVAGTDVIDDREVRGLIQSCFLPTSVPPTVRFNDENFTPNSVPIHTSVQN